MIYFNLLMKVIFFFGKFSLCRRSQQKLCYGIQMNKMHLFYYLLGTDCVNHHGQGDGAGFWYKGCSYHFPTRTYGRSVYSNWMKGRESTMILSEIEMKVRPRK